MKLTKIAGWGCAILLLAAHVNAATTFVPGILKREVWPGWTRTQVETNISRTTGNAIIISANVSFPDSWNVVDGTLDYADRYCGEIIPTANGVYDFFVAADDDDDVFFAIDDNPTNKVMIAQETGYSAPLFWTTPTAGVASQKNSATFTNGAGATLFAGGFSLNAGQRYYLEAVHHGGGGANFCAVTMVYHGLGAGDGVDTTLTNTSPMVSIGYMNVNPTALSFTTQPANKTNYAGMSVVFSAAVSYNNSAIPAGFQWLRIIPGVSTNEIPGANNVVVTSATAARSSYTLVTSTNDNGIQFGCVARCPGIGTPTLTTNSAVATLTVQATGGLTVPGRLKQELFTGFNQTIAGQFLTNAIGSGSIGAPSSVNAFASFETPSAGLNYGERLSGYFTPPASDYYVFFLASDDESQLFVSTDDQPANKRLVAQEDGFSLARGWNTIAGGTSMVSQKRSDQWVPDPFNPPATPPYASGIFMQAGSRYYIEAIHWGGAPDNLLGATFVTSNNVVSGLPVDGDPSAFTNGVISYVTRPVTIFTITNQPADVTVYEGFNYAFRVGVRTDSEITPAYQWRRNGAVLPGATSAVYTSPGAASYSSDNNAHFSCDIAIPGVTNTTSTTNTLTVIQGVFASGQVRQEIWTNTTTVGSHSYGVTRALVEANAPGTVPSPDVTSFIPGFDYSGFGQINYIEKLSGYFIPPVTTNYVFYVATDDDGSLYLSTNDRPENKQRIAYEPSWSNAHQWTNAAGGGAAATAQKCSSTYTDPITGVPGLGNPNGILLTNGSRYYMEVILHQVGGGDPAAATYTYFGATAPANGTASILTGSKVGVLVPAATVLNITSNPQSATVGQCQPVYFTVAATNDSIVPATYQWRRNGTNIPGDIYPNTGLIASTNDNGAKFDCIASAAAGGLSKTSTVATLTVTTGGTLVPGYVALERWSGVTSRELMDLGGLGYAPSNSLSTNIDFGNEGNGFGKRVRGFFIPPVTTNYVFFITSDDDSYLYLSPDDQPFHKVWIAEQQGWGSAQDNWLTPGGGGAAASQMRSDTFTTDGGVTFPGNPGGVGGIPLTAGGRYYIEVIHHEIGGPDFMGVTYKYALDPDPLDAAPSIITSSMLAYLEAPTTAPQPTLTATKSGNLLTVSWTPAGGTLWSSPSLSPPSWTSVGTINPTNLTIGSGNLFLRVQSP
jgi:hypothetical protein